jgi:hypothetical protein
MGIPNLGPLCEASSALLRKVYAHNLNCAQISDLIHNMKGCGKLVFLLIK